MKTSKILLALFTAAVIIFQIQEVKAQHSIKQIVNAYKANLYPFNYDTYASTQIIFDTTKTQTIEVEFCAFAGQNYKIVICTSGFEEQVKVNIYDKSMKSAKRTKVYDTKNGIDNLFWSFIPEKTGTYYINYEIPPSISKAADKKENYMVMIIGYDEDGNASKQVAMR